MKLDLATPADIPVLHSLIESAYRGESARHGWTHEADLLDGQRTDEDELRDMIGDPAQHILIHRGGAGADACIAIAEKSDGLVYLGMITVDPDRQGGGLGKALLQGRKISRCSRLEHPGRK
ncbi:GNAT family N-acetyltransferase [Sphingomonas piscis]|uniref:GNAT family N-acetyltransferase n=1 Tax=Sphingomonas piscis TaxID=2714943 RepID=UPI001FE75F1D|nr:GNAT family N-acetyltransferase [Sphingomonas piscis]